MLPLSVIIPTYNRASLLDKTLHSLTHQSRTDFHTILVDHGSTDNTEEVYWKYKDSLQLSYYKIAREEYSPGAPRDFGVRKSETPVIVFLDCGTVVPSRYIEAHIAFHRLHSQYVGIGLRHGYRDQVTDSQHESQTADSYEDLASLLGQQGSEQAYLVLKETQLQDVRASLDLENAIMPWYFGWTTNLSLPREAYFSVGGFDLELKGWGFEDVDLCYRLSKQGLKFAFVEDGWSIELPQPRQPLKDRIENGQRNMFHGYLKQRSLALESLLLATKLLRKSIALYRALPTTSPDAFLAMEKQIHTHFQYTQQIVMFSEKSTPSTKQIRTHFQYMQQAEEIFHYLTKIGQDCVALPPIPAQVLSQFTQPTLLIGGTVQQAGGYDYLTLADERSVSTPSIWSCCGILIPLADQSLETVVVSDIWKKLDWSYPYPFDIPSVSLLEFLLSEIQRTAKKAIFIHSPSISSNDASLSVEALESMCQRYGLSFQIVSLE